MSRRANVAPRDPGRSASFDGRVLLIGAERELPYERPPLTKDYLRGESARSAARSHVCLETGL